MDAINFNALRDRRVMALPELLGTLGQIEALENPDTVVDLSELRMADNQNIVVPSRGELAPQRRIQDLSRPLS
jgi:hypothetical protein